MNGLNNMKKNYKDVSGYENSYIVYDNGTVESLDRYVKVLSKYGKLHKHFIKGRILKHTINNKGYHTVNLTKNGIQKRYLVSRLVAQAFIPNNDLLKQVNHKDGDKSNNNVANLLLALLL